MDPEFRAIHIPSQKKDEPQQPAPAQPAPVPQETYVPYDGQDPHFANTQEMLTTEQVVAQNPAVQQAPIPRAVPVTPAPSIPQAGMPVPNPHPAPAQPAPVSPPPVAESAPVSYENLASMTDQEETDQAFLNKANQYAASHSAAPVVPQPQPAPQAVAPAPVVQQAPAVQASPHNPAPQPVPAAPAAPVQQPPAPAYGASALDANAIISGIGEAVYRWTIGSDTIEWSPNAAVLLQMGDLAQIGTGRAFALHTQKTGCGRHDAVMNGGVPDTGNGVPYRTQYAFQPNGAEGETLWIEDVGSWFAGADNRPSHAEGAIRIVNEQHEADTQARYLARHDELTGQLNRSALMKILDETLAAVIRNQSHACFMIAAVDSLAVVNDAYGFAAADEMLVGVAKRIKTVMRGGDAIGRFSGNKFGLVLGQCTETEMEIAAARFIECVANEPIMIEAGPVPVSLSIGGVALPRFARGSQEAVNTAQDALDKARGAGRGRFAAYHLDPKREEQRKRNSEIADELIKALNDQRINVALHDIIDAKSGEVAFRECLTRLERPDGSVAPANDFIELAEKLGIVRHIDMRAMDKAVSYLQANPGESLSVNVSMVSVCNPDWFSRLNAHIVAAPEVASRLIIEITETAAIDDTERASDFVKSLRDMGCGIAIDDFGAGFTNYRNLRDLNADFVKIDGSFIRNLVNSEEDQIFVRTLVELARHGNLKVVAEWVENEETAALLREWGVDYLQGSLFGEAQFMVLPEPEEEAVETDLFTEPDQMNAS